MVAFTGLSSRAPGNQVSSDVYSYLQPHVHYARLYLSRGNEEEADVSAEHGIILQAFRDGDGEGARNAIVSHLEAARWRLLKNAARARALASPASPLKEKVSMMASFGHAFLDGQVAIVTGAAQGNGYAIAERLVAHGCSVAAVDINAAGIEAAAERLGTLVTSFVADCADVASIRRVIGEIDAALGRVDILVNNAGILRIASFPDIGESDFDATIALNLKGAFFFTQEVQAKLGGGARIVNIASVAGVDGRTLSAPYAASEGRPDHDHQDTGARSWPRAGSPSMPSPRA